MPIPDYQTLMLPVLRILGDGADHTARAVIDAVATEFNLTPEEREQLVGNQRIKLIASRAHWAMTYLAQAGLTDRPTRGVWRVTDKGRRLLATGPERIDNAVLSGYDGFQSFINRSAGDADVDEAEALESGADTGEAAVGMPSVDDLLRPKADDPHWEAAVRQARPPPTHQPQGTGAVPGRWRCRMNCPSLEPLRSPAGWRGAIRSIADSSNRRQHATLF